MIKKSFSYIGISFLNFLSLLPLSILHSFATLGYLLLYRIFGYRKQVVRRNLTSSFPEKTPEEILQIEKTFFKYLASLIFEVIKLHSISNKELEKRVKFNNLELVQAYFDRGENVLACTGHYGNWEMGMMALGLKIPGKAFVIYKPLSNTIFDEWFYKWRTRTGNIFVPMRQTLRSLASTRNQTTMFCFAGDQTPASGDTSHWLQFLNQPTPVLEGLEKIALQTNRPVIYFNMQPVKRGYYEVDCTLISEKPKETREHELTEKTFGFLEQVIQHSPPYWLWSHRRWKHKPNKAE
ncbi:MAG: lauroyl acyltransferase [Bacteroidota bacterium]